MSGLFYGVSLVPAALGVLSTYYVVACFTNRTSIEISAAHLRVSSGPLPWIGNISLGAEDFTDIIVVPRPATGLHMGSFSIWSVDDRKWRRRLIWFLPEKRQADFIAQQIAQRWGLKEPSQH